MFRYGHINDEKSTIFNIILRYIKVQLEKRVLLF